MTTASQLDAFRASADEFAGHLEADHRFVASLEGAADQLGTYLGLPGDMETAVSLFRKGIDLPDSVVTALSPLPYGIGSAIRRAADIGEDVAEKLEPLEKGLGRIDSALEPVTTALGQIEDKAGRVEPYIALAADYGREVQDVAGMIAASMSTGMVFGHGLSQRLDGSASFMDEVSDFHGGFAGVRDDLEGAFSAIETTLSELPAHLIDAAADTLDTVFKPISSAFDSIEGVLDRDYTVIPGVPAVFVPSPWGPVQITPAIPPLVVNPADVLAAIDNAIGAVQRFVEGLVEDALDAIGFDLFGAIDRLKEKLLEPFEPMFDAVESVGAKIAEIAELAADAMAAARAFFEDLADMLIDLPADLFDTVRVGTGGDDMLEAPHPIVPLAIGMDDGRLSDALFGLAGDDGLIGNRGDDFLFGGAGDDSLDGGADDDELYGGAGADSFHFSGDFGHDYVSDGTGGETLSFAAGVTLSATRDGVDLHLAAEGTDNAVTVEGWYEEGRYEGAQIRVGGELVEIAGKAPAPAAGTPDDDHFDFAAPAGREIDGGAGIDTVSYALSRKDVEDRVLADGSVEIEHADGRIDRLTDVERVEFDDGAYLFGMRAEAETTYRLYAASLGRTPDEAGLRFWDGVLETGFELLDAAEEFLGSGEFAGRFEGIVPEAGDYVSAFYENVLGRVPDGGGFDHWVGVLEGGLMDAADLLLEFVDAPENLANQAENYDDGIWVA
ncbi:hypothetical protein LNKW23_03840 [Paralimibaculum aggregatum]|uniref:DUF4214 domain-containing protein n=1 Tax=Paralimibaculum aggregatum TaxID=3036245 RepID=A0ABQ6LHQ7_9RHOB|nr:DUF4214 domain-containing protein [Limibaculum sp. NKW23]GMG81172.1 hypothetical protein LNKW23_03840 [Limibaculum sp. NKW23]